MKKLKYFLVILIATLVFNSKSLSQNTLLGDYAGSNSSGHDNTFIGAYSGESANGFDNTAIGLASAYGLMGNQNAIIGYGNSEFTGDRGVVIGYYNFSLDINNQLYIGHGNNPLIWGDFSTKSLTLGNNFHINGSGNVGINRAARTDGYKLSMGGHIIMNNYQINYVDQIHFNSNVRFYDDSNDNYLKFKYGDVGAGGIKFYNGNTTLQGYLYSDGDATNPSFGLLDADGNWTIQSRKDDYIKFQVNNSEKMRINSNGNVGIGTNTPQSLLSVNGIITSKEVNVTLDGWADYVFEKDYKLKPLNEVESFIEENRHLPEVPSEAEVMENGVSLGEMNAILLKKIEELTLYIIEQEKKNAEQDALIQELQNKQ